MRPLVILLLLTGAAPAATPAEVFESRILPIFRSPKPSSCVKCHLAGVDLKDYILPDAEKTFRSLRDQGLIDLDAPQKSRIVGLIERNESPVAKAEREAFLAWIAACAADPKLRAAPKLDERERAAPAAPVEVIRHARGDRLLDSFDKNVWAWRFRCMNCHTEGTPQNDKLRKEHGDRVAWVKKAGAAATMEYLIDSKLIDVAKPEDSLILRKPLGEMHGGGVKFVTGDDGYKGFRLWIEDVAAIRGKKITTADEVPPRDAGPRQFGTEVWFKLTECPPDWGDKFLRVELFAWDAKAMKWDEKPLAVTDRVVFGKGKLWQHTLTLLAERDSDRAKAWGAGKPMPPDGKFLVKVYVDREGRLAKDWKVTLGEADFVGQAEFAARWREGYGAMTVVNAATVKK